MPVIGVLVPGTVAQWKVLPSAITPGSEDVFSSGAVCALVVTTKPMSTARILACGVVEAAVATTIADKTRWSIVAAPPGVPSVVGTVPVSRYASGLVRTGRTWTWGNHSNAPTAHVPLSLSTSRGLIQHHYHATEQRAPRCALCCTRHTTGGRTCHRCIVAGVDVAVAPLFGVGPT